MLKIGLRPDCSLVAIFTFEMVNPMPTLVYWEEHPDRRMSGPESSRPLGANSGEGMMGKVHERLDDRLIEFIGKQHRFFVGTAPDSPVGHLNVSPKGLDTFRILGPTSVAYLDLTGSGIETVAYRLNPVDNLAPLAVAKVPILLVYGDSDRVVPHSENSEVVYNRDKALGGPVERIVKPGQDHHPHGLSDPGPIVEFFETRRKASMHD
jgi:pimeloyl-ACP methyl ester carboxylesterase